MATYERNLKEKNFVDSLERALHTIKSGMKVGADNLEMILDGKDIGNLGLGMIDVLNRCEIEYKQGKGNKVFSLNKMVSAYHAGKKEGARKLFNKHSELEDLSDWYHHAGGWVGFLDRDDDIWPEHFADIDEDYKFEPEKGILPDTAHIRDMFYLEAEPLMPPSNTYARQFLPYKEIGDLFKYLEEKVGDRFSVREEQRGNFLKLKNASADKYAYTRAEILGMLDLYKGY